MLVQFTAADLEAMIDRAVARAIAAHTSATFAPSAVLLARSGLALALGCSVATIDRMDREGMPHTIVGRTRRYDLASVRAWLNTRQERAIPPTTTTAEVVTLAGCRRVSRGGVR